MTDTDLPKKQALFFACCDTANFPYAVAFWNSMVKFHDPKDIDMVFYTTEKRPEELKKLPKGVILEDLTPYIENDPIFFYRQKPVIAEKYLDNYELVVGFDVDQIIVGDLNYILNTKDYDCGTVINWNRIDPLTYGYVDISRLGVFAPEYYNCGLVAMRSKRFVHHWSILCFAPEFAQMQYKEQDILNILCHFGNYNIRNLDAGDGVAKYYAWHGLISKGEWPRAVLMRDKIIVPKGFGPTPFPPENFELKVLHFGEGNKANKTNYRTYFNEEIIKRLDYLVAPSNGK